MTARLISFLIKYFRGILYQFQETATHQIFEPVPYSLFLVPFYKRSVAILKEIGISFTAEH